MSETQYRPIDKTKDKKQIGDEVFDIVINKWERIDRYSIRNISWLDGGNYRRPVHLDLENGKYRIVTNEEAKNLVKTGNCVEYFTKSFDKNYWEKTSQRSAFFDDYIYRAPVEAEQEPKQCEQIMLACATTGKQCKSRGVEKDCEMNKPFNGLTIDEEDRLLPDYPILDGEVTKEEAFIYLKNDVESGEHLREHFLKMQSMLNEMFPLPKEKVEQCTCKVIPSGLPEALFLFPKKNCPVKAHADHSQLQGSKRETELPKEKAPFVFPSYQDCQDSMFKKSGYIPELLYEYIKQKYEEYLKSS